jgi:hypothetical protein
MPNLRELILAVGCTAILGASTVYAQARNDDSTQRWYEQKEQGAREWREQQEKNTREWREKQEQILTTWREAQEERTQKIREVQEARKIQLRELLTEQTEQLRELNRKQSEERRAFSEKRAQQTEEFRKSGNYAGLESRTKSESEPQEQKAEVKTSIIKKLTAYDLQRKAFADTITEKKNYASLLEKPELAGFFARYPNLKGTTALPATRINSSVTNPKTLDDILEKVTEAIAELPKNYAEVMKSTQVKIYVAATTEEMRQKCKIKSVGGCYIPEENTVCVSAEFSLETYTEIIPHELSHVLYEKLPEAAKQKLTKNIKSIVHRPEIKSDVIKDKNSFVKSWKDGLTLPRYACTDPYGASNANEFIAEYVEDIYNRGGRKLAVVLKGDYRQDAVKALEAMKEAGFLGTKEEAYVTLGKVFERAER